VKRDQGIDVCRLVAQTVIEHPKQCGWRFFHLPASGAPPNSQAHGDG
jgi:hypothetical protein